MDADSKKVIFCISLNNLITHYVNTIILILWNCIVRVTLRRSCSFSVDITFLVFIHALFHLRYKNLTIRSSGYISGLSIVLRLRSVELWVGCIRVRLRVVRHSSVLRRLALSTDGQQAGQSDELENGKKSLSYTNRLEPYWEQNIRIRR